MALKANSVFRNRLLNLLSDQDRQRLAPRLEPVSLHLRQRLEEPDEPIPHVYFMESGFTSIVAVGNGDRTEAGIVGREGVTGLMVVMGNDRSPHESFVQMAGSGMRISSDDLRAAMEENASLRALLLHYAQAFMIQTAHTALANARGKLEERLARWLLMAHDRVDGDELPLIHEFLALMLASRRAGVTETLQILSAKGLIHTSRGLVVVTDRNGLETAANRFYGVPEARSERLVDEFAQRASRSPG